MTLAMIKKEEYKEGKEAGLEEGMIKGIEQEREYSIVNSIELMLSFGLDEEDTISKVAAKYNMAAEQVRQVWEKS